MTKAPRTPGANSQGRDTGPWGWKNAKAWQQDLPSVGALEIALYTDYAELSLEFSAGPYTVVTPLSTSDIVTRLSSGVARMALVVRVERHLAADDPDYYLDDEWDQTDPAIRHGGDAGQELAALLSLSFGIRLRAGGIMRVFGATGEDPRGYPHEFAGGVPYVPPSARLRILPHTSWPAAIDTSNADLLGKYASLSSSEARALVRSARAYQEALWIAESDPRQAWLRLVSAVEIIAGLAPDAPAVDRLRAAHPDIADRVLRTGDTELIEWITARFADQGRSTAKFRDFLKNFRPPPPRRRPAAPSHRVNWRTLDQQMRRIYDYRSIDLHAGVPFPEPMCQPPFVSDRRIAHEVSYVTKDWKGDAPIHLHVFEYVVRSAIQAWWRSTGARQQ